MNNTRFVYIGKVMPDVRWHNKYSVHPHHELIVILGGVMHISGKTQELTLRAGEAALYPAGVHHWEQSDETQPVESCFIVFEDPFFPPVRFWSAAIRTVSCSLCPRRNI